MPVKKDIPCLGNSGILFVAEEKDIEGSVQYILDGKKGTIGTSAIIFPGVVSEEDLPQVDVKSVLKNSTIKEEAFHIIKDEYIFEKEGKKITSKKILKKAIENICDDKKVQIKTKKDLQDFMNKHVKNIENTTYYCRDFETEVIPSFLNGIKSFIHKDVKTPGVVTPMFYIGGMYSCTSYHDEAGHLASLNLLLVGGSKIWIVIDYKYYKKLIKIFHKEMEKCDPTECLTDLLHKSYFLTIKFLKENGISFVVFPQSPGDLVFVHSGSIHAVINTACTVAEAINFGDAFWLSQLSTENKCPCPEAQNRSVKQDTSKDVKVTVVKDTNNYCPYCPTKCKSVKELSNHAHDEHGKKIFKCEECNRTYTIKFNLQHHMKQHAPPVKCDECDEWVSDLQGHIAKKHCEFIECENCHMLYHPSYIEQHRGLCETVCPVCKRKFDSAKCLAGHLRTCKKKHGL